MHWIGPTERETECVPAVNRGTQEAVDVGACSQPSTHTGCHGGRVEQGFAHGCVVIISHWGQEEIFHGGQGYEKEHLSSTRIVEGDLVSHKQLSRDLGSDSCRIQKSTKDRLLRKRYMGTWRRESMRIKTTIPRVPTTLRRWMRVNTMNKGTCSPGALASPSRTNSVTPVLFSMGVVWESQDALEQWEIKEQRNWMERNWNRSVTGWLVDR